jgi:hypothetical protein
MEDKYNKIQELKEEDFKRLTGISKELFKKISEIVRDDTKIKKSQGGKPNKLSIENQILLMLEYYREYRTYFHIGASFGVSEATAYRIVTNIELVLIKHFKLPNKKDVLNNIQDLLLIDVTEIEIQRPKKNKSNTIQVKRKSTQ